MSGVPRRNMATKWQNLFYCIRQMKRILVEANKIELVLIVRLQNGILYASVR